MLNRTTSRNRLRSSGFFLAFSALRLREYRFYFWSGMAMTAAQGIETLALAWLVLDLTNGSVAQLGLMIFVRGIPMTVLSLFGGVLADRYNRRNILIYNQALTLLNMAVLGTLVLGGLAETWHVHLSSLFLGVASAITAPARQALIRGLVSKEEMLNAVALNSMQMNASRIIWPTLAGSFIAFVGTGPTFIACAVLSLAGMVLLVPVHDVRDDAPQQRRSPVGDLLEGMRYTFTTPVLAPVMALVMLVGMLGLTFLQLAPGFAREVLNFNSREAGLFLMVNGLGALTGTVSLLFFNIKNRLLAFTIGCAGFSVCLVAIAANPWFGGAFAAMFFFGLFHAYLSVLAQTIFQLIAPSQFMGRVTSLFMMTPGIAALITLPMGYAGEEFGLRWAVGIVGASSLVISVVLGFGRLTRGRLFEPESQVSTAPT